MKISKGSDGGSSNAPSNPQESSMLDEIRIGWKKEEEPLELQVCNQGIFKTEQCNKWKETCACPYCDHCPIAHGINELRPPRYKSEVCRMVLTGDICRYGPGSDDWSTDITILNIHKHIDY